MHTRAHIHAFTHSGIHTLTHTLNGVSGGSTLSECGSGEYAKKEFGSVFVPIGHVIMMLTSGT
jgi:hypothetical protein